MSAGGISVHYVKATPEQEAATARMLATPCPYCSDPAAHQRELKGKGRKDSETLIAPIGKFWQRDPQQRMLSAWRYDHGDYFRITFDDEYFIPRFKGFRLEVINFPSPYSPWAWASHGLLFLVDAAPSDLARRNRFGLNVARVTHGKSPVVVDAHTWFSHGSILTVHHVPRELSSADVTALQEALEFFRPETRGAPKVKDIEVFQAIKALGEGATQAAVAKRLGIGKRTLSDWLKRNGHGFTWKELREGYLSGNIV